MNQGEDLVNDPDRVLTGAKMLKTSERLLLYKTNQFIRDG